MTVEKTKTKAIIIITPTNQNKSKERNEPITVPSNNIPVTHSKHRKNHTHMVRLVLVLLLVKDL